MIGFAVFLLWETIHPFFHFFKGSVGRRGSHMARNLGIAVLNTALVGLCFLMLWQKVAEGSTAAGLGLLHRSDQSAWLHALLAILLLDAWTYLWHRANHRIALLWRFHRMHHSDPWIDVTTIRRFHPGEISLSAILRILLIYTLGKGNLSERVFLFEVVIILPPEE